MKDPENGNYMNCLTGKDLLGNDVDIEVFGAGEIVPHKRLEFFFKPCTPVPKKQDGR
jgi:hypothetical protein